MLRDVHPITLWVFDPALGNGTVDICVCGSSGTFLDGLHARHHKPKVMDAPWQIRRFDQGDIDEAVG